MLIGVNASSFKPSEISACQEMHAQPCMALEFKSMEDR